MNLSAKAQAIKDEHDEAKRMAKEAAERRNRRQWCDWLDQLGRHGAITNGGPLWGRWGYDDFVARGWITCDPDTNLIDLTEMGYEYLAEHSHLLVGDK